MSLQSIGFSRLMASETWSRGRSFSHHSHSFVCLSADCLRGEQCKYYHTVGTSISRQTAALLHWPPWRLKMSRFDLCTEISLLLLGGGVIGQVDIFLKRLWVKLRNFWENHSSGIVRKNLCLVSSFFHPRIIVLVIYGFAVFRPTCNSFWIQHQQLNIIL